MWNSFNNSRFKKKLCRKTFDNSVGPLKKEKWMGERQPVSETRVLTTRVVI